MKKLPIWDDLLKNYPNDDVRTVFTNNEGKIKLNYDVGVFKSACATRISRALNLSHGDHQMPYFQTKGSDGNGVVQVSPRGK